MPLGGDARVVEEEAQRFPLLRRPPLERQLDHCSTPSVRPLSHTAISAPRWPRAGRDARLQGMRPNQDLAGVEVAFGLLAVRIDGLTEDQARGLSRLPGWTRGHLLTHIARNADGLAGSPTARYMTR